ncbi:Gfo/Idh/MocA family protein [Rhodohalobacter sulfatireducens]|uniref:Gfo/Idh/MocA family oxidoreductase n=1 Tax=Rhodohalobacter sulfatireducens TaxID=2911366 RepID=A0ABS9KCE4_9BACT|nr:Gfo/Idh/MocA family oxidoreductase [Rhodohalobacter sulfatireducens]MCG2588529.1 Gfo/Idh/MocA family oxidoreductase [Rhodohalobacter sulfatireducens]MDR9367358.1 Gfo/Idh/MocA family oxidoreductase [Balneolaceae bacterium]
MADKISRKIFLKRTGALAAVSAIGFPSILLSQSKEKLGVALVGLGSYSTGRLAPGLQMTDHCELRGIVTGSPEKIPEWQEQYNIPDSNVYNYENMHEIANNDDIDIVYIVLPTGLHAKYSIIGAEAGKHVWCEKPMAMNVEECQNIIDAVNRNNVSLAIGYRLHHEPNTQQIMQFAREQTYGAVTEVRTAAGYDGYHEDGNWRKNAELGGGALYDMGVYPINAIRYATQMEPIAVNGRQSTVRKEVYPEVDEITDFQLEFSNGMVCTGETSFGKSMNYLNVNTDNGWYYLKPMSNYSGVQGMTSDGTALPADPGHQQARQMDGEALAIKEGRPPIVPGSQGLNDIRIVNAIMESSRNGRSRVVL